MSDSPIHTRIWLEEPEANNPFAARTAYCHGYDVYGQMVGRASWTQMVFLLFRGEAPTPAQANLLDALAVALANPGPRDPSVHAAMCGGVGGATAAASLIAALSVGAGQTGGARDVFLALHDWAVCGTEVERWRERLAALPDMPDDSWPDREHPAGFDPNGVSAPTTLCLCLDTLAAISPGEHLPWLRDHRLQLESAAGLPLAWSGLAAAAYADLGCSPEVGEMLHLLLRLPGAAAHALEQWGYGFKRFPFPALELEDDPGPPAAATAGA